jgi:hypothetical protein
MTGAQSALPLESCPRCRAPLLSIAECASVAVRAENALKDHIRNEALRDTYLEIPGAVTRNVGLVSRALACLAQTCRAETEH